MVFSPPGLVDLAGDLFGLTAALHHAQVAVGLLAELAAGFGLAERSHGFVERHGRGRQGQAQRHEQGAEFQIAFHESPQKSPLSSLMMESSCLSTLM